MRMRGRRKTTGFRGFRRVQGPVGILESQVSFLYRKGPRNLRTLRNLPSWYLQSPAVDCPPMKKYFFATLTLLLASCTAATSGPIGMPLQERLHNPLVADRYWGEMAEHMADLVRFEDPITK